MQNQKNKDHEINKKKKKRGKKELTIFSGPSLVFGFSRRREREREGKEIHSRGPGLALRYGRKMGLVKNLCAIYVGRTWSPKL